MSALNSAHQFSYLRHRPERNLVYQVIETYWPLFLEQQSKVGQSITWFIQKEFDAFLDCGIPENGFIRTYCYQCHYRQWVLSFPFKLRYLMAFDQEMTNFALKVMLQTIASFQKKNGRDGSGLLTHKV